MNIHKLGTLGGEHGVARAINAAGHVVGEAATRDGARHAFFWTPEGGMRDLGAFGYVGSTAVAINAADEVVGQLMDGQQNEYPFLWSLNGGMHILEPERGCSEVLGISDAGRVLIHSYNEGEPEVLCWTASEGLHMLPVPDAGAEWGSLIAGGDGGALAGKLYYSGPLGGWILFRWVPGHAMEQLELPSTAAVEPFNCDIEGHSTSGYVVGWYREENGLQHALLWMPPPSDAPTPSPNVITVPDEWGKVNIYRVTPPQETHLLQKLDAPDGRGSIACAVNDQGLVVGCTLTAEDKHHAFSWTAEGGMRELCALGGRESVALALNNAGQVVGWAADVDHKRWAVLWMQDAGRGNP